jgi:uncharacterized protein (DUF58 family)
MLFIGLGLTQGIAFLWARSLQKGITLTRERRYTWAQVGDRLEERFTVNNKGHLPAVWLEIVDHSTLPGYTASQVTGVGYGAATTWHTDGICTQRGVFQLGPTEVKTGDPFGLFEVQHFYPNMVDLTIVPPILSLPTLEIATRGQSGETVFRPYSFSRTQATATVRLYEIGDSLNKIHWPTTARRDDFYVRNLEATSAGDWWLALDLEAKAHHGHNETSTLEKAILIASSLADKGLSGQHAVGLLAQGKEAIWIPPLASSLQISQILKTLALARPGELRLEHLLARNRQMIGRNTSLVVITASTNLSWLDPMLLLMRQGVTPTVILIFTEQTYSQLQAAHQILVSQGIKTYLLDQAAIVPPTPEEAAGRWEWYVTGTGKAVAIHKPKGKWELV